MAIRKTRRIFEIGHYRAELSDLEFPDGRIEAAAIERNTAEEATELVRRARLEARLNESYAAYLQRRLFAAGSQKRYRHHFFETAPVVSKRRRAS
jgi:hypothetical protein